MQYRCRDPKNSQYKNYGGRGIDVCDAWLNDVEKFARDMGPKPSPLHSLDRINNDGNYEPGNCRWATRLEQARNKKRGAEESIVTWCGAGWAADEALENQSLARATAWMSSFNKFLCLPVWMPTLSHLGLAAKMPRMTISSPITHPSRLPALRRIG